MDFESNSAFDDVWFGIGFSGLDGMRYMTFDSYVARGMFKVRQGGGQQARLRIEHFPLQPGMYQVDVGTVLGFSLSSDYVPGATQVEVLPGKDTPSYLGNGRCGVRAGGDWDIIAAVENQDQAVKNS
jgi:hypothetical protein